MAFHGDVGPIGSSAFYMCSVQSIEFGGSVGTVSGDAFILTYSLETVRVRCDNPAGITGTTPHDSWGCPRSSVDVVYIHDYSATYAWSDDGKSCTVGIVCGNDHSHDTSFAGTVTSEVKTEPTTESMGTTLYTVSGTYDGFGYSSTKEVQDIPAVTVPEEDVPDEDGTEGDASSDGKDFPVAAVVAGGVLGVAAVGAAAFLLIRRR